MREELDRLKQRDAELLAVDPHEIYSAKFLLKETGFRTEDLQFPLLMDASQTLSATYGVAFQMRIHTELSNRPSTFLIDKKGVLRYAKRGISFADRPKPAEIVRELKKIAD